MRCALCLLPLALGLGISNALWAATPIGDGDPAIDHLLRLRFTVYPSLPAGSVLICKARLEGSAARSGSGTTITAATMSGDSPSQCAMEVPFRWSGSRSAEEEVLRYEIEAEGLPGMVLRTIAAGTTPLPALPPGPGDLDLTMQVNGGR